MHVITFFENISGYFWRLRSMGWLYSCFVCDGVFLCRPRGESEGSNLSLEFFRVLLRYEWLYSLLKIDVGDYNFAFSNYPIKPRVFSEFSKYRNSQKALSWNSNLLLPVQYACLMRFFQSLDLISRNRKYSFGTNIQNYMGHMLRSALLKLWK